MSTRATLWKIFHGVALGSAAKTASIHNVDIRIMCRIGVAAKNLEILDAMVIIGGD